MFRLNELVRPNVLNLKAYSSARKEFQGKEGIFLDANENPYGQLNRYPDPLQTQLKEILARQKSIPSQNIFIGNGSDEVIDLAFRVFCRPGIDKAIAFKPSYGMYQVSADINNVSLTELNLTSDFEIDLATLTPCFKDSKAKLLLICSPNNPTGNLANNEVVETILKNFQGIVIIDEAYIDFSEAPSWIQRINEFPNLIVCQTLSKAWGLAAARVGMAFSNNEIVNLFNKIKPPYNVSAINQAAAITALNNTSSFDAQMNLIISEKKKLIQALKQMEGIQKVFPSEANFILIKVEKATEVYQQLIERGIIIRNRHSIVNNCLRISIGKPEENKALVDALKNSL